MKDIKRAVYKIGKVRIPDYILGTISAFVLIIGFPYVVQSQQSAEISTEAVGDGRYVLFGRGGNILASIGDQGVLIVDSQFPDMVPKYQSTIRSLGGDDIDFTINTHWHYDHADGNELLGESGSWIIAHAHSRDMMTKHNTINTEKQRYIIITKDRQSNTTILFSWALDPILAALTLHALWGERKMRKNMLDLTCVTAHSGHDFLFLHQVRVK